MALYLFYYTHLAVSVAQPQHKEKTVSANDDDVKKPASPSTGADAPSSTKMADTDTDDATFPSDDDLKKPQKETEHSTSDVLLEKSAKPLTSGETVVSEKDTKEDSETTTQIVKTETATSTAVTLPQQPGV